MRRRNDDTFGERDRRSNCGVPRQRSQPTSTITSVGKLILDNSRFVAEFETDIRKESQREGTERSKAAGVYKGRKPTVDVEQVRSLRDQGLGATDIATKLRIARASVYRALKDQPATAT